MAIGPEIRSAPDARYPAGPTFRSRLFSGRIFRLDPLAMLTGNRDEFGDLVHFRGAGRHIFQCNHPELVGELLVTDARHHHRGLVMQKAQFVLGKGLLSSEDPLHLRQRRLAQPAFHRDRIAAYGQIIGQYAEEMTQGWTDGSVRNVHDDMQLLALRIVGKTLFDSELESVNRQVAYAVDAFMAFLPLVYLPFTDLLIRSPIPMMQRIRRSRRELDTLIYTMIAERRADGRDRGDLLSMLLRAQDEEEGTGGMSDVQVRDEVVTALLAGNETTANGLSFALWLMAQHPDAQERLHQEACAAFGSRTATASDYPALPVARACFAEAMRLYPPVWTIARTASEDYDWRGFRIPKGALLLAPQWVLHRDERFFPDAATFRPERFLPDSPEQSERTKHAYFPFAAGGRQCIGEGLAWMEGVLTLATIARSWRLEPLPGDTAPKLEPRVTLRPKGGLRLRLAAR